jgi:hypothetical protein
MKHILKFFTNIIKRISQLLKCHTELLPVLGTSNHSHKSQYDTLRRDTINKMNPRQVKFYILIVPFGVLLVLFTAVLCSISVLIVFIS